MPDGAIIVLTGLGTTDGNGYGYGSLAVDGVQEVRAFQTANGGQDTTSVRPVAVGFTASAGSVLSAENGVGKGRAWGYLVRL